MEIPLSWQKKLKDWWPSIYAFVNGFSSYLLVESKKIAIDVFKELFGKSPS